ncbi:tRNA pseudouridine(55) synthase TruB [Omnitrophica bacterium]|nr:tRNA pseudouridine(55) synthase TruB [Candidatus Omnitrophota bacterium]
MNGILIVDKPTTWTSHDVCAFVKKRFRIKKVGHAGTLDPLATGVLVLLLGKATKQSMALSACDKEYDGVMELGLKTDSHDRNGKTLEQAPWEHITLEKIIEESKKFCGEITQTPPMVSALKHQGVRLYQLARKGVTVPRKERNVTVQHFDMKRMNGPFVEFSSCVSKGTYLRTLVNDLGDVLGCFATLAELRRVRSGESHIKDALTIDELKAMDAAQVAAKVKPVLPTSAYANLYRN